MQKSSNWDISLTSVGRCHLKSMHVKNSIWRCTMEC